MLDHAALHRGVRLAGYAANLEFWVEEIRHAFDCLERYKRRHTRLVEARRSHPAGREELDPALTTPTMTDEELRRIEQRLKSAAKAFLKHCCAAGYIDHTQQREIEQILGVRINFRRHLD